MIFDAHVRLPLRDRPLEHTAALTVDRLLGLLDGPYATTNGAVRCDRALVVADAADTALGADLETNDRMLVDAVRSGAGRLVGAVTVNPLDDLDTNVRRMRTLVGVEGFRAVKLEPTRHGFLPHRAADLLGPVLEEASSLGVPVLVHVGEPPFGFPSALAPVIESHRDVTFALCNFGTQQVCYAHEAVYVAQRNDNVVLHTAHAPLIPLRDAVSSIGPSRLLFASDLPAATPASALAVLDALRLGVPLGLELGDADVERMLTTNAADLLGRSA